MMSNEVIIDGCNVAECDRYCKFDNRNEPNKCYSYISEGYNDCKPKEYQCFFYVKEIEKQLQRLKAENEKLKEIIKTNNPWYKCKNCNKDYKQTLEEIRER